MTPPPGRHDDRDCEHCPDCGDRPGYQGGCRCPDDGTGASLPEFRARRGGVR